MFTLAGPYDELLYVPGYFNFKSEAGKDNFALSVTRIYVSAPASVKNGRANWGVPSELALERPRCKLS